MDDICLESGPEPGSDYELESNTEFLYKDSKKGFISLNLHNLAKTPVFQYRRKHDLIHEDVYNNLMLMIFKDNDIVVIDNLGNIIAKIKTIKKPLAYFINESKILILIDVNLISYWTIWNIKKGELQELNEYHRIYEDDEDEKMRAEIKTEMIQVVKKGQKKEIKEDNKIKNKPYIMNNGIIIIKVDLICIAINIKTKRRMIWPVGKSETIKIFNRNIFITYDEKEIIQYKINRHFIVKIDIIDIEDLDGDITDIIYMDKYITLVRTKSYIYRYSFITSELKLIIANPSDNNIIYDSARSLLCFIDKDNKSIYCLDIDKEVIYKKIDDLNFTSFKLNDIHIPLYRYRLGKLLKAEIFPFISRKIAKIIYKFLSK